MMQLGVVLPNEAADANPRQIADLARHAEALGFASVWLPDHLLPPTAYGPVYGGVFEPLALLSHIAAVTTCITLGTSVLILPLRDPFLVAKQTATLERLAPGRVILGVGTGWEQTEFAALNVAFQNRGARTDEAIGLIRHLHRTGEASFHGRFYDVDSGVFAPTPTSAIPLMIGGVSDAALRRTARFGDMWQAFGLTRQEFRARRETLRTLASGRSIRAGTVLSATESLRGTETLEREVRQWEAAGADNVAVHFGELPGTAERMTDFMRSHRGHRCHRGDRGHRSEPPR